MNRTTCVLAVLVVFCMFCAPLAGASTWNTGDIFVAVSGGSYNVYDSTGVFKETISDGTGGFTTGAAFNPSLTALYTTNFSNTKVVVYDNADPHPIMQVIDTNATTPGGHSESVVFTSSGDFLVGHPDGNDFIHRYDAAGNLLTTYAVAVDNRGTDWIDIGSDQVTLFYTSEGRAIQRFDTMTNTQLPDFASLPGFSNAFALRLLAPGDGSGGLLVADRSDVKRLDGAGAVSQTYDVAGEDSWFSLNLDPDGTSFWAANFETSNVYRFDIATGVMITSFNTGTGAFTVFGICLKGEPTAAVPTNNPPVAVCMDATLNLGDDCCTTVSTADVDGGSFDPDADDSITLAITAVDGVPLPEPATSVEICGAGVHTVTLTATDEAGLTNSCDALVTLLDVTAPSLTCAVGTPMLWSPNHDLVDVGLSLVVSDCDEVVTTAVTVYADEDDEEGRAEGRHSPDAKQDPSLRLRSERRGDMDGRVYLIVATATDSAGNATTVCCTVGVSHDQSEDSIASIVAQAAAAETYCSANGGAAPPGFVLVGDGAVLGPKQ